MNWFPGGPTLQYIALFLAVLEFILALYVLLFNPWHTANRHVSFLLFLGAVSTLGEALLLGTASAGQARLAGLLLSVAVAPVQPALLITSVVLVKPGWMPGSAGAGWRGRWRWIWYGLYGLVFLPGVLTLFDATLSTGLWYTGLPVAYGADIVSLPAFTQGTLAPPIKLLCFQIIPVAALLPLLYVALRDRGATPLIRRLAWVLLIQQVVLVGVFLGLRYFLPDPIPQLLATVIFTFVYAYVVFQESASRYRIQRWPLRPRMTLLILAIVIPLLVAVPAILSLQAGAEFESNRATQLEAANRSLANNVSLWLEYNIRALHQMVALPEIVSMDPGRQKPVLQLIAAQYPNLFLVQTADLRGLNVARNDDQATEDYGDRQWYLGASTGAPVAFQSLVSRTTGEPSLNIAAPIRDAAGQIVGVGSIVSQLDEIGREVQVSEVGESGFAYVVDATDRAVAHPDPAFTRELRDLSTYPPVVALRQGISGFWSFTDEQGRRWQAYLAELPYGWGAVVQQPEAELLDARRSFQRTAWLLVGCGAVLLVVLTWLTVSQILRPVAALTETVTAIAAGDLDREAPVEGRDEIGVLAQAVNSMTGQLRALIGSLEEQVAERTRDLARRSGYLQATAEVGRAAASILDVDRLIRQVVDQIRERFDLYYVGLFLLDEAEEWAVLRAGTGPAGQAMLTRGHRIRVGEGMIGWCIAHGQSRVALVAEEDAVRLATQELPDTRSEAALPLRVRGNLLGALTVQHTRPGVFDEDSLAVLQTMADQVAVAISNAQLFRQAEAALEAERRAYGQFSLEAWSEWLRSRPTIGYRSDPSGVKMVGNGDARQGQGGGREPARSNLPELSLPLRIHDRVLGNIQAHKPDGTGAWTAEEIEVMEALGNQLGVALESARLYQDTQRRAVREQLVGQITARMRETLDVDTVLQAAIREMGAALGIPRIEVRLGREMPRSGNGRDREEKGNGHAGLD
jgi:GAF domain-containing protein/HAMP domain-containing protein